MRHIELLPGPEASFPAQSRQVQEIAHRHDVTAMPGPAGVILAGPKAHVQAVVAEIRRTRRREATIAAKQAAE